MKNSIARRIQTGILSAVVLQAYVGVPLPAFAQSTAPTSPSSTTPIKHVIVIIGENRSFDHVYATYKPPAGQTVSNLLSKGIVNNDGSPGPNYYLSAQYAAVDSSGSYTNSPQAKSIYFTLPPAMTDGAPQFASDSNPAPFQTLALAKLAEPDLAPAYNKYLLTGATGLPGDSIDTRLPDATTLREGPYQITPSIPYDAYTASPVHRFFQMWQQTDCNRVYATADNPSGCLNDLFPWVETSVGAGSNGKPQPADFSVTSTGEGSTAMQFYNVQRGDASYMRKLAETYTLSDNFHQSVMGGTGANHIMFGFGDAIWYSDGKGHPAKPPALQIENPNPQKGTDNYYDQDGYSGGSYVNCANIAQPGVAAVRNYLESLPNPVPDNCQASRYYLVNNYNPGYNGDGTLASQYSQFTIPPTSVPSIGDVMMAKNLPFKYFGEGWDLYVSDPTGANPYDRYCNICNPFQYQSSIMTNPALREAHIGDTTELYEDIDSNNLPAVSIVKPSGFTDGHPASSKLDLFEGFVKKIVNQVQAHPKLWAETAIFVTFDEGGGYYDSGYIQPVDFFGDGTRIPLIVISPYSKGGRIVHQYADHVSVIKFIEKNWDLGVITDRSRDNLPNPKTSPGNPYVPVNSPALDDLSSMFQFPHSAS